MRIPNTPKCLLRKTWGPVGGDSRYLRLEVLWDLHDLWRGVYVAPLPPGQRFRSVYICILPTLVLHFRWKARRG